MAEIDLNKKYKVVQRMRCEAYIQLIHDELDINLSYQEAFKKVKRHNSLISENSFYIECITSMDDNKILPLVDVDTYVPNITSVVAMDYMVYWVDRDGVIHCPWTTYTYPDAVQKARERNSEHPYNLYYVVNKNTDEEIHTIIKLKQNRYQLELSYFDTNEISKIQYDFLDLLKLVIKLNQQKSYVSAYVFDTEMQKRVSNDEVYIEYITQRYTHTRSIYDANKLAEELIDFLPPDYKDFITYYNQGYIACIRNKNELH